jgi:hypothetical protein
MSDDHGAPISYMALKVGTPVFASDGRQVGFVAEVRADADTDIFDGIVIDSRPGPGGRRFVDAPEVARIAERAVTLSIDTAAAAQLPEPRASPAGTRAEPGDGAESGLTRKLRNAWDRITRRS